MDSKLQIISGTYRGRKLILPAGARPTQNLARGAVFNMLASQIGTEKLSVWDAFAGSGALGIEVLSRYPNSTAIFTDTADESLGAVRKNVATFGARATVVNMDAVAAIKKYGAESNIIFVDPPYENADLGVRFVKKLAESARPGTIVVQEIEKTVSYTPDETKWEVLRDKTYGRAHFVILRRIGDK